MTLFYINTSSNHPRSIIKQIPTSVSHRLSDNSTNEEIFNNAKTEYDNALKTSGHTADLEFNPNRPKNRNKKRNIIWFNPPFNKNIKTNIGKTFLKLIDKHFPRSSKLHKIFNRNTIKVSYSCTENMSMIIKKHNKKIINNKATPTTPPCNCRKKTECPLNGNCQQQCHLSSNGQDKKQARKSFFRTNRRTMETKKLRTQISIQRQKICTQYSTFEICMRL